MDIMPIPPGTQDPYYDRQVTWVRTQKWGPLDTLRIAQIPSISPLYSEIPESHIEVQYDVLVRRRAYAPAPYAGRAFNYTWWVWIDQDYRQIAENDVSIAYTESVRQWQVRLIESLLFSKMPSGSEN